MYVPSLSRFGVRSRTSTYSTRRSMALALRIFKARSFAAARTISPFGVLGVGNRQVGQAIGATVPLQTLTKAETQSSLSWLLVFRGRSLWSCFLADGTGEGNGRVSARRGANSRGHSWPRQVWRTEASSLSPEMLARIWRCVGTTCNSLRRSFLMRWL